MKTTLTAIAFAATLAQPASAITFSKLTTIYVASGVTDSGNLPQTGVATTILCSNVSGANVQMRVLILSHVTDIKFSRTAAVAHGKVATFSTNDTLLFGDEDLLLNTGAIRQGTLNIEATNSAVFCTAAIVDAAAAIPNGIDLHLVRVNPHPGTVE
jgi:hypothetical protein